MIWKTGTARQLLRDIRKSGRLYGQSGLFPHVFSLNKGNLIHSLRDPLAENITCQWRLDGELVNDRVVTVYLGK